ncbi:hypothetical protein FRX31_029753 [Thalictrum thalictroides]|uniref:Uncharacterized protein n=1 Tax=Thalictrum thalictroides TaxID=46969 RepID=A0A7J6V8X2_THATH|nr:hypothetical protein FRX31_029753 [Thalictrum thalictroides]
MRQRASMMVRTSCLSKQQVNKTGRSSWYWQWGIEAGVSGMGTLQQQQWAAALGNSSNTGQKY